MSRLPRSATYFPPDTSSATNCRDARAITRMLLGRKLRCHLALGRGGARPATASPKPLSQANHSEGVRIAGTCQAVDGHTLRCNGDRMRLLGLDAPEKRKCRLGRKGAPGIPKASRRSLEAALTAELRIHGGSTEVAATDRHAPYQVPFPFDLPKARTPTKSPPSASSAIRSAIQTAACSPCNRSIFNASAHRS